MQIELKGGVLELWGKAELKDWEQIKNILENINKETKIDTTRLESDFGIKILINSFLQTQPSLKKEDEIQNEKNNQAFGDYVKSFYLRGISYLKNILNFSAKVFGSRKKDFQSELWWQDVLACCYKTGLMAIPIVLVLSSSLGFVLSLQGAKQLRTFGGELYAIDLLVIAFFREMGILITAIILAARSGSAIISKIGIMKITEEWDAIKTIGINPIVFIIQPRIVALIFMTPILGYIANLGGLLGGFLTLQSMLNLKASFFASSVASCLKWQTFFAALWKGPIFGAAIGLICSFEGRRVSENSESVAIGITKGVVYSIASIILLDTVMNIIFWGIF